MIGCGRRAASFLCLSYGGFYYLQYDAHFHVERDGLVCVKVHDNWYTCRELCMLTSFRPGGVNKHLFAPLKYWQVEDLTFITIY